MSKTEKHAFKGRLAGFGLHCFPDIQVEEPSNVQRCLPAKETFQRAKYDNIESHRTDMASRSDTDGTCNISKGSISTAQLNEQAYQRGFADGREKGAIDAESSWHALKEKKIEPLIISLKEMLLQLNSIRHEAYRMIEKEIVELALAIARQVICQETTIDKEIVVCVAREALAKVEDPGRIKIKMSPADLQFINETQTQLSSLVENFENVTLEATESIQRGGCIIETDLGEIDARIEKQLQAVEESFRIALEKS